MTTLQRAAQDGWNPDTGTRLDPPIQKWNIERGPPLVTEPEFFNRSSRLTLPLLSSSIR